MPGRELIGRSGSCGLGYLGMVNTGKIQFFVNRKCSPGLGPINQGNRLFY